VELADKDDSADQSKAMSHSRSWVIAILLMGYGVAGLAGECDKAQKRELKQFFKGRRVTASIDLPLVHLPGGMWVFWNGEYDLETYAESLKHGPASILRGQSSVIKDVRVRGKDILYEVGGGGLMAHWQGPYDKTPAEVRKHGSLVGVAFGRKLTAADCSVESNIRALSGVMDIAGVDAPPPLPGTQTDSAVTTGSGSVGPPVPAGEPGFELISAEVEPTRVRPGESIRLITHFKVTGGSVVEVAESRQLYSGDQGLFSQPRSETTSWPAGVHESTLEFEVPAVAGPGFYRYEVVIQALGQERRKDSLFEIY
jgi:hypothetical protein